MKNFTLKGGVLVLLLAILSFGVVTSVEAQLSLKIGNPAAVAGEYQVSPAFYGQVLTPDDAPVIGELVWLGSNDGCAEITEDLTGRIVMVTRGNCNLDVKARNAQAAGAAAAILVTLPDNFFKFMMRDFGGTEDITIPYSMALLEQVQPLINSLSQGTTITAQLSNEYAFEDFGTPLWTEDFADGLTGWSTENIDGVDTAVWSYNELGTSPNFVFHMNSPTSRSNGSAIYDAAFITQNDPSNPPAQQTATLTSPEIDLSGAGVDDVLLTFYSEAWRLNPRDARGQHFVEYSINGGDEYFEAILAIDEEFQNTSAASGLVQNGTFPISFLLEDVNATEQLVIRFTWNGDVSFWGLDDIAVFEVPAYNIELVSSFYPLANQVTPVAHIATDTFGINCVVRNAGSQADDPVDVRFEIIDENGNLVPDATQVITRTIPQFEFDTVVFDRYVPNLSMGDYTVRYSATLQTQTDEIQGDNVDEYTFRVSDIIFQGELADQEDIQNGDVGDVASWYHGVFFLTSPEASEEERFFQGGQFAFDRNDTFDFFDGNQQVTISLVRYADNNDGFPSIQDWRQGNQPYPIPEDLDVIEVIALGGLVLNGPEYQLVDLLVDSMVDNWIDANTLERVTPGDLVLEPGGIYGFVIELNQEVGIALAPEENPQSILGLLYNPQGEGNYFTGLGSAVPVIRLYVGEDGPSSTDNINRLDDAQARIFPTVTSGEVTLAYSFDQATEASYRLFAADGRLVGQQELGDLVGQGQMRLSLGAHAAGLYYLDLMTDQGMKTTPVMIAR